MIIKSQNNIKKKYQSPSLEVIRLDNHISLHNKSDGFPIEEPDNVGSDESLYNKPFPDAPASKNPFGGSSPNYK